MKQKKRCKYRIIVLVLFLMSLCSSFSSLIAFGHSESSGLFDGMYIKYNLYSTSWGDFWQNGTTKFTYSHVSGDIYHVTWNIDYPYESFTGSWDEDSQTRIVSNYDKTGPGPWDGTHTWVWILTNISLNDIIPMFVVFREAGFNVTRQFTYDTSGYGTLNVWELTEVNATHPTFGASVLYYENSTGILVGGRLNYFITGDVTIVGSDIYELKGTNALPKIGDGAIPGYHYFFLISMFSIFGIVIIKYRHRIRRK